ncbi:hypothetical protein LLB_2417 [Legionella longbeachae D-4968]|nr:hypothetical protein LLB_2417 [Legionella longbeachae D-4968]
MPYLPNVTLLTLPLILVSTIKLLIPPEVTLKANPFKSLSR